MNYDCGAVGLVDRFWNPTEFWRPNETHCLNVVTLRKISGGMAKFWKLLKNSFVGVGSLFSLSRGDEDLSEQKSLVLLGPVQSATGFLHHRFQNVKPTRSNGTLTTK